MAKTLLVNPLSFINSRSTNILLNFSRTSCPWNVKSLEDVRLWKGKGRKEDEMAPKGLLYHCSKQRPAALELEWKCKLSKDSNEGHSFQTMPSVVTEKKCSGRFSPCLSHEWWTERLRGKWFTRNYVDTTHVLSSLGSWINQGIAL